MLSFSCFFFFYILKQVPIYYSCSGEHCNTIWLWSSRNVLWMTKLHLTVHRHSGDQITTAFSFWVNRSFNIRNTMNIKPAKTSILGPQPSTNEHICGQFKGRSRTVLLFAALWWLTLFKASSHNIHNNTGRTNNTVDRYCNLFYCDTELPDRIQ